MDRGAQYGNVVIVNNCDHDLYLFSLGAWAKEKSAPGLNTLVDGMNPEGIIHTLPAHGEYKEPYREICPKSSTVDAGNDLCVSLTKEIGNGASLKISKVQAPTNVTQVEYSLIQETGDFPRLDFDVSLLDCAKPENEILQTFRLLDQELVDKKFAGCPGYEKGLAVWFDEHAKCRHIYCDSQKYCDAIYLYDRTRQGEMSLNCLEEYRGDFHIDLCVENGASHKAVVERYNEWVSTASSETSVPVPTDGGAPVTTTVSQTFTPTDGAGNGSTNAQPTVTQTSPPRVTRRDTTASLLHETRTPEPTSFVASGSDSSLSATTTTEAETPNPEPASTSTTTLDSSSETTSSSDDETHDESNTEDPAFESATTTESIAETPTSVIVLITTTMVTLGARSSDAASSSFPLTDPLSRNAHPSYPGNRL
ncbi:hypothetical protein K491DRAFT_719051 [Lophiostoma macrostomum CBS 122681]|uniref:Uncharacterized protein n=1 Tax=Lophiostoma macrostomum CBS 122681 TaxID=1314788 RepID=A0A6A6SXH2_9PLEO|nr:hypothetical protein K491DRAFT_719051 [Lophiostoma macrostomum CBS 122681]